MKNCHHSAMLLLMLLLLCLINSVNLSDNDLIVKPVELPYDFRNELKVQTDLNSELKQYRDHLNQDYKSYDIEPHSYELNIDDDVDNVLNDSGNSLQRANNLIQEVEENMGKNIYATKANDDVTNDNGSGMSLQRTNNLIQNVEENMGKHGKNIYATRANALMKPAAQLDDCMQCQSQCGANKPTEELETVEVCTPVDYDLIKKNFLGTNLFGSSRIPCFSRYDVALLTMRRDFEILVPKSFPKRLLTNRRVCMLIKYFNEINHAVGSIRGEEPQVLARKAFYDSLGGYLNYYMVPMAKLSFYAGKLKLYTAERIIKLLRQCKVFLNTNGNGWRDPINNLLNCLPDGDIKPLPSRPTSIDTIGKCPEKAAESCAKLDLAPNDLRNIQMICSLPRLESVDSDGFLSNVRMPYKNRATYNLRSSKSAFIFIKFYKTITQCYQFQKRNQELYNKKFKRLILERILKHIEDDQFYPGLGGILQILQTLKNCDSCSSEPQTGMDCKSGGCDSLNFNVDSIENYSVKRTRSTKNHNNNMEDPDECESCDDEDDVADADNNGNTIDITNIKQKQKNKCDNDASDESADWKLNEDKQTQSELESELEPDESEWEDNECDKNKAKQDDDEDDNEKITNKNDNEGKENDKDGDEDTTEDEENANNKDKMKNDGNEDENSDKKSKLKIDKNKTRHQQKPSSKSKWKSKTKISKNDDNGKVENKKTSTPVYQNEDETTIYLTYIVCLLGLLLILLLIILCCCLRVKNKTSIQPKTQDEKTLKHDKQPDPKRLKENRKGMTRKVHRTPLISSQDSIREMHITTGRKIDTLFRPLLRGRNLIVKEGFMSNKLHDYSTALSDETDRKSSSSYESDDNQETKSLASSSHWKPRKKLFPISILKGHKKTGYYTTEDDSKQVLITKGQKTEQKFHTVNEKISNSKIDARMQEYNDELANALKAVQEARVREEELKRDMQRIIANYGSQNRANNLNCLAKTTINTIRKSLPLSNTLTPIGSSITSMNKITPVKIQSDDSSADKNKSSSRMDGGQEDIPETGNSWTTIFNSN